MKTHAFKVGAVAATAVAMVALAAPGATGATGGGADTVLLNGYVYTVDGKDSVQQAMVVDNGRIVYVGTNAGARKYAGKATNVVNLKGKMVMPGLVDGHIHALGGGEALVGCNLRYAPLTVPAFQAAIQKCLDDTDDGNPDRWLSVDGWYVQAMLPPGTTVTKAVLDALPTTRPIVVSSTDGHTAMANSRALAIAGITASTPNPVSGSIERGPDGEPTGVLQDGAQNMVRDHVPPPTAADDLKAAQAAVDALAAQGVTSFMEAISSPESMTAFSTLADTGKLTSRAHLASMVSVKEAANPAAVVKRLDQARKTFDDGALKPRPGVTVRNLKIVLDGVVQAPAQTAAMLTPYLKNAGTDESPNWVPGDTSGALYWNQDQLTKVLKATVKDGWDPHIHAIGDRSVRVALNATQAVRKMPGGKDARISFAHTELVDPADFARFAKLDVVTAMGFQWAKAAPDSIDAAEPFLGPSRFSRYEPEGDLFRHGATISLGSDWPVDPLDEWFSLKVVITRTPAPDSRYASYGPLNPKQALSRKAAVRAITINGAYQLHEADQTGSLEKGKFADYIVLDRNIMKVPAADIANTNVLATVVGGKLVYGALR